MPEGGLVPKPAVVTGDAVHTFIDFQGECVEFSQSVAAVAVSVDFAGDAGDYRLNGSIQGDTVDVSAAQGFTGIVAAGGVLAAETLNLNLADRSGLVRLNGDWRFGDGGLNLANGVGGTLSGVIAGSGKMVIDNAGTLSELKLTGGAVEFANRGQVKDVTITGGMVLFSGTGSFEDVTVCAAGHVATNGVALELTGNSEIGGNLYFSDGRVLAGTPGAMTFSGVAAGDKLAAYTGSLNGGWRSADADGFGSLVLKNCRADFDIHLLGVGTVTVDAQSSVALTASNQRFDVLAVDGTLRWLDTNRTTTLKNNSGDWVKVTGNGVLDLFYDDSDELAGLDLRGFAGVVALHGNQLVLDSARLLGRGGFILDDEAVLKVDFDGSNGMALALSGSGTFEVAENVKLTSRTSFGDFSGRVAVAADRTLTVAFAQPILKSMSFSGGKLARLAVADGGYLSLARADALTDFGGTIEINAGTLAISGDFTGMLYGKADARLLAAADLTLSADLTHYAGSFVAAGGRTLTLAARRTELMLGGIGNIELAASGQAVDAIISSDSYATNLTVHGGRFQIAAGTFGVVSVQGGAAASLGAATGSVKRLAGTAGKGETLSVDGYCGTLGRLEEFETLNVAVNSELTIAALAGLNELVFRIDADASALSGAPVLSIGSVETADFSITVDLDTSALTGVTGRYRLVAGYAPVDATILLTVGRQSYWVNPGGVAFEYGNLVYMLKTVVADDGVFEVDYTVKGSGGATFEGDLTGADYEESFAVDDLVAGRYALGGNFGSLSCKLYIYNDAGKKVASGSVSKGKVSFKAALLAAGDYTLSVVGNKKSDGKFVAQLSTQQLFAKGNNEDDDYRALPEAYSVAWGDTIADEWAGFGDVVDYRKLLVTVSGEYDFRLENLQTPLKLTVYELKSNGKLGSRKSISVKPKYDKKTGEWTKNSGVIENLLLTVGSTYYLKVESTTAGKGEGTCYDLTVGGELFDNPNNLLLNNTWAQVKDTTAWALGDIENEWVGIGDAADWFKFGVRSGEVGEYALNLLCDNARCAGMTLYAVDAGSGKLKKIATGSAMAGVNLATGDYALSVISADQGKGRKNTSYEVRIEALKIFSEGNNADDDYRVLPEAYSVAFGDMVSAEWVGFGDAVDYRKLAVSEYGEYDFSVENLQAPLKLTVYELKSDGKLRAMKSISIKPKYDGKSGLWTKNSGVIEDLLLAADGTYYLAVESTSAGKGEGTAYELTIGGELFDNPNNPLANDSWDEVRNTAARPLASIEDEWVGIGDAADWFKFEVGDAAAGNYDLTLVLERNQYAQMTLYAVDADGVRLDKIRSGREWDRLDLEAGIYALSVISGDGGKGKKNTGYAVSVKLNQLSGAAQNDLSRGNLA